MNNINFTKSVRFRLTLWYSLILAICSLALIISINLLAAKNFNPPFVTTAQPSKLQMLLAPQSQVKREALIQAAEETRADSLKRLRNISVFMFFVIVGSSFAGGYFIAGIFLQPLKRLSTAMDELDVEKFNKLEQENYGDEFDEIIEKYNEMVGRLENAFEGQKQFVENASHEIKTPLTIIRANMQNIEDEVDKGAKEDVKAVLDSIDFLDKLINDLLLLSVPGNAVKFEDNDLADILEEVVEQMEIIAKEKKIAIEKKFEKGAFFIPSNDILLKRAFMNLIENGIKYSKEKSKVKVILIINRNNAVVKIEDEGEGISEQNLKKVQERFFRVDKSRSRATGGSGLGLSIAKHIFDMHRAEFSIASEVGKGTEAAIRFTKD